MTVAEIQSAIINTTLSNDEINQIAETIKYKRSLIGREVARTLTVGDQVRFTDSRQGRLIRGRLEGIKIKNAVVTTPVGRYRVPLSMLTLDVG
jgi:hypothetical protein